MSGPLTVSAREAADLLGVSVGLVYKRGHQPDANGECWLIPGKVRILRSASRLLIPRCDLEALNEPAEQRAS